MRLDARATNGGHGNTSTSSPALAHCRRRTTPVVAEALQAGTPPALRHACGLRVPRRLVRATQAFERNPPRARLALTWRALILTLGRARRDHCDYALDKSVRPNSAETRDWSTGRIRTTPVSEVQVVEGEG
jgi:hypothetical protein